MVVEICGFKRTLDKSQKEGVGERKGVSLVTLVMGACSLA